MTVETDLIRPTVIRISEKDLKEPPDLSSLDRLTTGLDRFLTGAEAFSTGNDFIYKTQISFENVPLLTKHCTENGVRYYDLSLFKQNAEDDAGDYIFSLYEAGRHFVSCSSYRVLSGFDKLKTIKRGDNTAPTTYVNFLHSYETINLLGELPNPLPEYPVLTITGLEWGVGMTPYISKLETDFLVHAVMSDGKRLELVRNGELADNIVQFKPTNV